MVFAVYLIQYFGLHQEHHVVVSQLHCPDRLGQAKAVTILDIIRLNFNPEGTGPPMLRRHVELVIAMSEWLHEAYQHNGYTCLY